jgi:hypothetical protein
MELFCYSGIRGFMLKIALGIRLDRINREMELGDSLSSEERLRVLEIAAKCLLHQMVTSTVSIHSTLKQANKTQILSLSKRGE